MYVSCSYCLYTIFVVTQSSFWGVTKITWCIFIGSGPVFTPLPAYPVYIDASLYHPVLQWYFFYNTTLLFFHTKTRQRRYTSAYGLGDRRRLLLCNLSWNFLFVFVLFFLKPFAMNRILNGFCNRNHKPRQW